MINMYHEDLLDEAKNPSNVGDMVNPDLSSSQFNASCGDVVYVSVKLSEDKKKIKDILWKGDGCVISQASMSVLSDKIKGMTFEEIKDLTQKDILEELELDEISMGRVKCLNLGLSAVKKIISI